MFDTHAHLFDEKISSNIENILKEIKHNNFKGVLCICETEKEIELFLKYYKDYNFLYASVGVHPHNAKFFDIKKLMNLYNKICYTGRLVAIGETGLDFYYNFSSKEEQINCFLSHINFAKEKKVPLIIHSRNSDEELYNILKEKKVTEGVIHCFSSTYNFAQKFLDLGLYLGFTGVVTFKNSKNLEEVIKKSDINKIVIETDTPYLSPEPLRGKINTPLNLIYILKKLSQIKNLEIDKMNDILVKNSINLFNIKTS